MKKKEKNNFTKLTQKKGISLIVLIVTIIVIIILAAAVILTITKNNPVESAKEATFKEDVRSFQDELAMTVAKEYTDKQGQRDEKISTSEYGKIKECIPSFSEKYKGKFVIKDDKLVGTDELTNKEKEWMKSLNVSTSDKAQFDTDGWNKTSTPEDCFMWGSDTKGEDGYNVIIGYKENLTNYPKVRIPSRCKKIICDGSTYTTEYLDDVKTGRAFLNDIQKIEIPGSVTEIGAHAFGGPHGKALKSVKEIIIPDSVISIGNESFEGCSSLTSIIIPDSVTNIGSSAFRDCISLANITIAKGVTSIGYGAFLGCSSLTSITIPDSVTSIGSSAFGDCISLANITIAKGVTSIGSSFGGCSSLTSITIPDSVTSIESRAFENCRSLASIIIPSSVTSIGSVPFYGCSSLTNITYNGTQAQWNSINKDSYWNNFFTIKTITCTDGVLSL